LHLPRPFRALAISLVVAAAGAGLAACGSDDSSSGSSSNSSGSSTSGSSATDAGIAYAKKQIEAASAVPEFKLDAPAFDMSKIKGKTIFNIPVTSAVPYVISVDKEAAKVAKKYGAKWVEYTNQGTPNEWTAGVNQAISQKADAIIFAQGTALSLIIPAMKKAKAAGIPILVTHDFQNDQADTPPPTGPGEEVKSLTTAFVNVPFWEAARLEADWAIMKTNGKANVVSFSSPDVPPSTGITAAMKKEFTDHCPNCKFKSINVPLADWATKIASETQSAIQQDPGVNWLLPIYDSMSLFAQQGITAAGKSGTVKIASYNGTPAVMKLIQDGDIMDMDVGENITWLAWATMDQVGRVLTGAPIIEDGNEQTPLRVFSDANIKETGTPPSPNLGYGTAYVDGYNKLWSGSGS
jgi:ribose transport system substrate-binding protein